MLNHYCQKYFFQPNYSEIAITTMIKTIYELPGNFYVEKDRITVRLEVPPASSHLKDIEYALRRVNERHIVDHFGRKLWLEI
jgi:hypothetical protein